MEGYTLSNVRWLSCILCKIQLPSFLLNKINQMNSYPAFEMLLKKYTQKQLKIYEIK